MFKPLFIASTAAITLADVAVAQATAPAPQGEQAAEQEPAEPAADEPHSDHGQEIVVTGFRRSREDVISGTSVVSGLELVRDLRPTIGETLARQPGVSSTSFGPNASRPVLRGFQGDRIRVLTDGIGSLDASNTSVDHAVAINPLTAQRIEVLRGPSALLFGSSAIGGVVNVIDARIPRRAPDEAVHVEGIATYGSAANERSVNATLDVPLAGGFVVHADGNYSKTDDLRIGGVVLSRPLREEAAQSNDPEIRALATLRSRLPNTAAETSDVALGAAYIAGDNNIGFSVNRYDSLYGVPIRPPFEAGEEAEAPRIDIRQYRADARAEIDTGTGFIDSLRFRGGYADYRHFELEPSGEIGTTFLNDGIEGRLELVQALRSGWGGGIGIQFFRRHLEVSGEEKFLPESRTSQFGVFTVQNIERGALRVEGGARYERQTARAEADPDIGNPVLSRSFNAYSGSLGASYQLGGGVRIGVNASHSERAPSAEELFANGPHAGTQSFEIGNPDLRKERSNGVEALISFEDDGYSFTASAFHNRFDNYIFEQSTGEFEDDLPVFQIMQADARYTGFELEGSVRVARFGAFAINLDGVADYVRATIEGSGPTPRIPPFRLLGGVEVQAPKLQGRLEVERVAAQNRVAPFETPTEGFTMVNASVSFLPVRGNRSTSLTLSANNIFDVEARRHASFLKDFAPIAGRDIRLTARLSF